MGLVHYGLVPSRKKDSAMLALYQGRYSQAFMGSLGSPQSAGAQETVSNSATGAGWAPSPSCSVGMQTGITF